MGRPLQIGREDLAPILDTHQGNDALRASLLAASAPPRLLSLMGRYIQFNSAFGAGVANLAGEIAARQNLFRDAEEPLLIAADRAAEVGSDFFYAAIDEFDDRATPWRDTHRTLAQATLKAMGAHFGYAPAALNDVIRINAETEAAIACVWDGYGIGARLDEPRLFSAMGFHVGSEILADREFLIIDRTLKERSPELVSALKAARVELLGHKHDAYYWIQIHTGVEADHFEAALAGANKALVYYAGAVPLEQVKSWILEGFASFAEVQEDFMDHLDEA